MSLSSILGAVASTVQYAADTVEAAESAAVAAIVPAIQDAREAAAPVVSDLLRRVAANPQLFGSEVSGFADYLADTADSARPWPLPPTNAPYSTAA